MKVQPYFNSKIRNILILFLLLLSSQSLLATGQSSEIIFIDGEKLEMLSTPIESNEELTEAIGAIPNKTFTTACWRGYVGEWEIKDNTLYLNNLFHCTRVEALEIPALFDKYREEGRIKASWYSGDIRVVKGKMIDYLHHSFYRYHEYETIYTVENGVITEKKEYKNQAINIPENRTSLDMLEEGFVTARSYFDWNKFPELSGRMVFNTRLILTEGGKVSPASTITLSIRNEENPITIEDPQHPYLQEWFRCLNRVDAWPYLIVHDKIHPFPVYFIPLLRETPD